MQVNTCIKELAKSRGASLRGISADLGKVPTWGSNVAAPTRSPALATVTDIADVLGYNVAIVDRESGEIVAVVDPPRRASDVSAAE